MHEANPQRVGHQDPIALRVCHPPVPPEIPRISVVAWLCYGTLSHGSLVLQKISVSYKHVHTVFEGEAAMAAENARIKTEARELVKKRP